MVSKVGNGSMPATQVSITTTNAVLPEAFPGGMAPTVSCDAHHRVSLHRRPRVGTAGNQMTVSTRRV